MINRLPRLLKNFIFDLTVLVQTAEGIHHVRLLVSVRLIQPVNRVFLSKQTSTSQLKPAQKPTSEHAD